MDLQQIRTLRLVGHEKNNASHCNGCKTSCLVADTSRHPQSHRHAKPRDGMSEKYDQNQHDSNQTDQESNERCM